MQSVAGNKQEDKEQGHWDDAEWAARQPWFYRVVALGSGVPIKWAADTRLRFALRSELGLWSRRRATQPQPQPPKLQMQWQWICADAGPPSPREDGTTVNSENDRGIEKQTHEVHGHCDAWSWRAMDCTVDPVEYALGVDGRTGFTPCPLDIARWSSTHHATLLFLECSVKSDWHSQRADYRNGYRLRDNDTLGAVVGVRCLPLVAGPLRLPHAVSSTSLPLPLSPLLSLPALQDRVAAAEEEWSPVWRWDRPLCPILVREEVGDGIAGKLWDAAWACVHLFTLPCVWRDQFLETWLQQHQQHRSSTVARDDDRGGGCVHVVDLSCGTGYAGLAVRWWCLRGRSPAVPVHLVLTELDSHLDLVRYNSRLPWNQLAAGVGSRGTPSHVHCLPLRWGSGSDVEGVERQLAETGSRGAPRLILAADLLYATDSYADLVDTLCALSQSQPTMVLMSHRNRALTEQDWLRFVDLWQERTHSLSTGTWRWERVPDESMPNVPMPPVRFHCLSHVPHGSACTE